jgi:hypothetical protein
MVVAKIAAEELILSLNLNLNFRKEDAMTTVTHQEIVEQFATDPALRARFEKEIAWALKGSSDRPLGAEELARLWEDLRGFEETLGEVLEPRVSKTCLSTLVGGVAYEEVFAEDIAQPSSEEAAEAEEYEDPESPRWA